MSSQHPLNDPDLIFHLRSLTRIIHYVTPDEHRFLNDLSRLLHRFESRIVVLHPIYGAGLLKNLLQFYSEDHRERSSEKQYLNVLEESPRVLRPKDFKECDSLKFLDSLLADNPRDDQTFYIILDSHEYMKDPKFTRATKDFMLQSQSNDRLVRILFLVTETPELPASLKRLAFTLVDTGPTKARIEERTERAATALKLQPFKNAAEMLKGLTLYEIDALCAQSSIKTAKDDRIIDDEDLLKSFQKRRES